MGLLQRAIETYDANLERVGKYEEGHTPLAPIGHTLTNADIEVTLDRDGKFCGAQRVKDQKILIPVTEESSGRTSKGAKEHPHPLCDQVKYLTAEDNYYLPQLEKWCNSAFAHPFLSVISGYLSRKTLKDDLTSRLEKVQDDDLVCWIVNGIEGETPECWENQHLFRAFTAFYLNSISARSHNLCMVDGKDAPSAIQHPKGIIPINGNAKLISSNDKTGFTYRGRFAEDWQAATVGYEASQKAHNALRWLASAQGVREALGNRVFLCWNPQGIQLPSPMRGLRSDTGEPKRKPSDYQDALKNALFGWKAPERKISETAVLTAFDAATTGRLSVTYYNEIDVPRYLKRLREWDEHCCWYYGKYGIQSPSLFQIVVRAFGTERNKALEIDDRIGRQQVQRLLNSKISGSIIPSDFVKALAQKASTPMAYEEKNWRYILRTACAVLQKYRYDTTKEGGNEMSWELDKKCRSFQFGRLLAVMERAEDDYYNQLPENDRRQTNAIKAMSEFRRRPWQVFERVNRQLHQAYLNRMPPWQAKRYERMKDEICSILSEFPEETLNEPLTDLYLMGYERQRNEFFTKNEKKGTEE